MDFGERLKTLRETAGLSQERLARAAGISTSVVSKLEQKLVNDPGWQTVQALALALGVSCQAFEDEGAGQAGATPSGEQATDKPASAKPAKKGKRKKGGQA